MAVTYTPTAGVLTTGAQSTYAVEHGASYEGMQADSGPKDVVSLVNTSGGQLYFGHLIVQGNNNGCKLVAVPNLAGLVLGAVAGSAITAGSGYTNNGTYTNVSLTGGTGSGAKATIVVAGNAVSSVTITTSGTGYAVGDELSAAAANIGTGGSGFKVTLAAAQLIPAVPLGIAISSKTFEDYPIKAEDGRVGYPDKTVVNILRKGRVWVYCYDAVNVGDPVRVQVATDTNKVVGRFAKTAVSNKTALLSNAQFLSATTGAGLAVVEINGAALTLTADT